MCQLNSLEAIVILIDLLEVFTQVLLAWHQVVLDLLPDQCALRNVAICSPTLRN